MVEEALTAPKVSKAVVKFDFLISPIITALAMTLLTNQRAVMGYSLTVAFVAFRTPIAAAQ